MTHNFQGISAASLRRVALRVDGVLARKISRALAGKSVTFTVRQISDIRVSAPNVRLRARAHP